MFTGISFEVVVGKADFANKIEQMPLKLLALRRPFNLYHMLSGLHLTCPDNWREV